MKIDGYVIVPPVNVWDDPAKIIPAMSYNTFGTTPLDAWLKHLGDNHYNRNSTKQIIQRWFDVGYRLRQATLIIEDQPKKTVDTSLPTCYNCSGKGWYREPDPAGRGEIKDCEECFSKSKIETFNTTLKNLLKKDEQSE